MKVYITSLLIILSTTVLSASNANYFSFDEKNVEAQLATLTELDEIIESEQSFNLENIKVEFPDLVMEGPDDAAGVMQPNFEFDAKSFAWGLCCWPIGLFTVLLKGESDDDEKISYGIGAIIGLPFSAIIAYFGIYIVIFGLILGANVSSYWW